MASSRWALRAAATVTALAFALPFSSGTASADPLIQILGDNHVNATIGVSGNVDMIDVAAHAHASLDTGPGISVIANGGIQVALGLCAHADVGVSAGVDVGAYVDAGVAAHVSTTDDRAPSAAAETAAAETAAVETAAVETAAVAPAVVTEVVADDKTSTSVHLGGFSVNVGPHAAAMLDAHDRINASAEVAADASVGTGSTVGVVVVAIFG